MDTKTLGELGEQLACDYLQNQGYEIIGRNQKFSFGEIDVVARKKARFFARLAGRADNTIHFVEVKTLAGDGTFQPQDHIDRRKQHKLRQLCQIWLKKRRLPQTAPHQIDVVAVLINPITQESAVSYFPNAVQGA